MKATRGCPFSFHVIAIAVAIAYVYFSTVFVFIDKWLGLWSSQGIFNAVMFSVITLFCIFSYTLAIYTDPGRVPSSFVPDIEDENMVREIKRKGGDLRYCQKCSLYKPPRAHHCRVCNRCVLRMVLLVGSVTVDSPMDNQQSEDNFSASTGTTKLGAECFSGLACAPDFAEQDNH
ncbi:putative thaumatin-like protein-like [Capsicum annuum]|nr:putative thaumatin-like protein-like [Capsicum annuum]